MASLKMMQIITSGFFVASDTQRKKLQKIEWPFCEDYGLSNFMITDDLVRKKKVMNTQNYNLLQKDMSVYTKGLPRQIL